MADTTLPGVLLKGTAASRPAASAVAKGTIYSATDTGAITQSDGVSTWSTFATISSGLTDPMTTRGDIIVRNSSNTTARLGIGSSGKVLSSDGTDISWQTPASAGALTFLEAHTASSSATLDFTSFISSTYDDYIIEIVGILPATDAVNLQMEVGTGGGPTYDTTGSHYSSVIAGFKNDGSAYGPVTQNSGIPEIAHKVSNTTDYGGVQETLRLQLPQSTTQRRNFTGFGQYVTNDGGLAVSNLSIVAAQYQTLGTALTALRFLFTSGNIASGTIRIYGLVKS